MNLILKINYGRENNENNNYIGENNELFRVFHYNNSDIFNNSIVDEENNLKQKIKELKSFWKYHHLILILLFKCMI